MPRRKSKKAPRKKPSANKEQKAVAAVPKPLNFTIRADKSLKWGPDPYQRSAMNKRHADFLGNELHADMWFHVQQDDVRLPAHRLIVCSACPVLETIAYGTGTMVGCIGDVPVRDCSVNDFYEILRFVYTGSANLTALNVADILVLADYYHLLSLADECTALLLTTLSAQNVCRTFAKLHLLDNEPKKECLRIIRSHTDELFADDEQTMNLFDLDVAALRQVFAMDSLRFNSDVDLFAELLKWGRARCVADGVSRTSAHTRVAIDDRLDFVRFAAMTLEQFAECVKLGGKHFFSDAEISVTFQRIAKCDAATGCKSIKLTHYMRPRSLQLLASTLSWYSTKLSVGRIISEFGLRIKSKGKPCYLNGFDSMQSLTSFTIECSDQEDPSVAASQMIPIEYKMYGTSALFKKPLHITTSGVHLKFKYAAAVTAIYSLQSLSTWACSQLSVQSLDSTHQTYVTFQCFIVAEAK